MGPSISAVGESELDGRASPQHLTCPQSGLDGQASPQDLTYPHEQEYCLCVERTIYHLCKFVEGLVIAYSEVKLELAKKNRLLEDYEACVEGALLNDLAGAKLFNELEVTRARDDAIPTRGESTQTRDGTTQTRDQTTQTRDQTTQTRDQTTQTRDETTQTRDETTQTRDEATQTRDEATQMRDEATQMRDEATQARDEATQMRDEATQTRDRVMGDKAMVRETRDKEYSGYSIPQLIQLIYDITDERDSLLEKLKRMSQKRNQEFRYLTSQISRYQDLYIQVAELLHAKDRLVQKEKSRVSRSHNRGANQVAPERCVADGETRIMPTKLDTVRIKRGSLSAECGDQKTKPGKPAEQEQLPDQCAHDLGTGRSPPPVQSAWSLATLDVLWQEAKKGRAGPKDPGCEGTRVRQE